MIPDESSAELFYRLANKNINIIRCSQFDNGCSIVVEYQYERPRDNKVVWPKFALSSETPESAARKAEVLVDKIRGEA